VCFFFTGFAVALSIEIDVRLSSEYGHQTRENTASTLEAKKSSKIAEWVSDMRNDPVSDDSSHGVLSLHSGSSESEGDKMFRMKQRDRRKGKNKEEMEENRWLLSDFSSQEGRPLGKRNNSRPAR
jgi:hypothetical protein